jgi:DNA topoisomerase I
MLARRLGLRLVGTDALSIRRRRRGKGWSYLDSAGRVIRDRAEVRRLARLAVPPAYADVLYAEDPRAHLQAVGRDAAGRLQYRYHPEWEKVREMRKARRLARLADVLPRIRRSVGQHLAGAEPTREFALAAVIELVARSAIRPGSESHARLRGTRGAATLLKSNVTVYGESITLSFRSKGGKTVVKEFAAPALATALAILRRLPGRRLFQYRADSGDVRHVTAHEVNAFLREIAGAQISLKDFRTLLASASALEALARTEPAASERRSRQHPGDLPQELRARDRGRRVRGWRARAFRRDAQVLPLSHPPCPGAGADHLCASVRKRAPFLSDQPRLHPGRHALRRRHPPRPGAERRARQGAFKARLRAFRGRDCRSARGWSLFASRAGAVTETHSQHVQ